MNKIVFNLTHEFDIITYTRSTTIDNGVVHSYATASFASPSVYDELVLVSMNPITDIVISSNGTSIYHLANQNAAITSIYEGMSSESEVFLSATIQFNEKVGEEEAE